MTKILEQLACIFESIYYIIAVLTVMAVERKNGGRDVRSAEKTNFFSKKLASDLTFMFLGLGRFRT